MQPEIDKGLHSYIAAGTAIIAALGGTAIYNLQAPAKTNPPYLIIGYQSGGDTHITPKPEADVTYLVKCVSMAQPQASQVADLLRTRLDECDLALDAPWVAYRCQHMTIVLYVENVDGRQVYHHGGTYRIRATKES